MLVVAAICIFNKMHNRCNTRLPLGILDEIPPKLEIIWTWNPKMQKLKRRG
jgi:hypothetical protein